MLQILGVVLGGLVVALAALGIVYVVGMRRKSPAVLRAVRGFARTVVNPRMLATAGTPGAYASLIHHVGRTTGRAYRTPVVARPTGDGFVIALPYGTTANWVRNVLASGSATIVNEGTTYRVDRPQIVPLALMDDYFPAKERRSNSRFRIDQCIRLRRVDEPEPQMQSARRGPGIDADADPAAGRLAGYTGTGSAPEVASGPSTGTGRRQMSTAKATSQTHQRT